jgi:hypothetical protein
VPLILDVTKAEREPEMESGRQVSGSEESHPEWLILPLIAGATSRLVSSRVSNFAQNRPVNRPKVSTLVVLLDNVRRQMI